MDLQHQYILIAKLGVQTYEWMSDWKSAWVLHHVAQLLKKSSSLSSSLVELLCGKHIFFSFLQKLQRNRRFVTLWRITEFFYDVAKLQHLPVIMARQPTSQTNTCICIKNTRQFFCIDNFMFSTCSIWKIVWEIFFWKNVFGKK